MQVYGGPAGNHFRAAEQQVAGHHAHVRFVRSQQIHRLPVVRQPVPRERAAAVDSPEPTRRQRHQGNAVFLDEVDEAVAAFRLASLSVRA